MLAGHGIPSPLRGVSPGNRPRRRPPNDKTPTCAFAVGLYMFLCILVVGPVIIFFNDVAHKFPRISQQHTYNIETYDEEQFSERHLAPFLDAIGHDLKGSLQTRCVLWVTGFNTTYKSCYYIINRAWGALPPSTLQKSEEEIIATTPTPVTPRMDCGSTTENICPAELATQCSVDRIHRLQELLQEWDGSISVSIYTTDPATDLPTISNFFSSCDCLCQGRITAHLIVGAPQSPYPINVMRNLAMDQGFVDSIDLVSMYDVDFVPSLGLCQTLVRWYESLGTEEGDKVYQNNKDFSRLLERKGGMAGRREMLVVPSFEVVRDKAMENQKTGLRSRPRRVIRRGNRENSVLTYLFGEDKDGKKEKKKEEEKKEEKKKEEKKEEKKAQEKQKEEERSELNGGNTPSQEISEGDDLPSVRTKEGLLPYVFSGGVALFHTPFEGQLVNLSVWNSSTAPFIHTNPRLLNEHYVWFSRSAYKEETTEPLCDEFFFDRGYNKIMCYIQLRLKDFYPAVIPDGFLIHALEGDGQEEKGQLFRGELRSLNITKKGKTRKPIVQYRPTGPFYKSLFHVRVCEKLEKGGWLEKVPYCGGFCGGLKNLAFSMARTEMRNCYHRIGEYQGLEKTWKVAARTPRRRMVMPRKV